MTTKAQAFGLFLQEKYSEALDAFRDLATEDFSMRSNQALCAAHLGHPDWQTTDLLLDNTDKLSAPAFLYLAEVFLASENAPQALKFVDTAIAKAPDNIQAYLTRIDILEELGDGDGIAETLKRIFPKYAGDARVLCEAAGYAAHYGEFEQARYLLKKALKNNRLYTICQEDFYDFFLTMSQERLLLPFAKEAHDRFPNRPEPLYAVAVASALTGATQEADKYFQQLSRLYDVMPDKLKSMWADALFGCREYSRAFDMAKSISADYAFQDGIKTFLRKTLYLMRQTNPAEARERAEKWRRENPDDPMIAHYCAAIAGETDKPTPPPEVMQRFFDEFAEDFEDVLIANLHYKGDELLQAALIEAGTKKKSFSSVLDAGCGTGLMASVLKPYLKSDAALTGVDVSGLMLDEARKKAVYTTLVQQDIVSYCQENAEKFDCIVCMDVLSYFGSLLPVFKAFANALTDKGTAFFSVLTTNDTGFALQSGGQYKHSPAFVAECLDIAGLKVLSSAEGTLRYELDAPEKCLVYRIGKK